MKDISHILSFWSVFNKARGHSMERDNYLNDLKGRKPKTYVCCTLLLYFKCICLCRVFRKAVNLSQFSIILPLIK